MNRRIFIRDLVQISTLGSGFSLSPTTDFSKYLGKDGDIPFTVNAFEDTYKALYKQYEGEKQLDKVIKAATSHKGDVFWRGEGKNGSNQSSNPKLSIKPYKELVNTNDKNSLYPYYDSIPQYMSSPLSNLILHKDNSNIIENHQGLRVRDTGKYTSNQLVMFSKVNTELSKSKTGEEYLLIHPVFNNILANPTYFCYGIPIEKPEVKKCSQCGQFYFLQVFGYISNDPVYGKGTKTFLMVFNEKCNASKKFHDGIGDVRELTSCTCYEDITPVEINSGNLNKH